MANTVKYLRLGLGMSQQQFGDFLKVPVKTVRNWEQGVSAPPAYVLRLIDLECMAEHHRRELAEALPGQQMFIRHDPDVYDINVEGLQFLVVSGEYINGHYIALINWGVVAECSRDFENSKYDVDKLFDALSNSPFSSWLPVSRSGRRGVAVSLLNAVRELIYNMDYI